MICEIASLGVSMHEFGDMYSTQIVSDSLMGDVSLMPTQRSKTCLLTTVKVVGSHDIVAVMFVSAVVICQKYDCWMQPKPLQ